METIFSVVRNNSNPSVFEFEVRMEEKNSNIYWVIGGFFKKVDAILFKQALEAREAEAERPFSKIQIRVDTPSERAESLRTFLTTRLHFLTHDPVTANVAEIQLVASHILALDNIGKYLGKL